MIYASLEEQGALGTGFWGVAGVFAPLRLPPSAVFRPCRITPAVRRVPPYSSHSLLYHPPRRRPPYSTPAISTFLRLLALCRIDLILTSHSRRPPVFLLPLPY